MNTETILDIAKSEGTLYGSLAVAGGLEKLAPEICDGMLRIVRGIVLAAVSVRMADLAATGATPAQQVEFRGLHMQIFDDIVIGWLDRCRHSGALN